ncbi:element excision factor XisI family protein [Nostoc sp. PCC 9305]|uniref:element excision factor XisI family protein n=1 Tax=Nostoc sp. PCC 9305 TaxID=296636 RepID=UPI0039C6DDAD
MKRINYRELVQTILKRHSIHHSNNDTEVQLIFDTERDHYQVLHLGWEELKRKFTEFAAS